MQSFIPTFKHINRPDILKTKWRLENCTILFYISINSIPIYSDPGFIRLQSEIHIFQVQLLWIVGFKMTFRQQIERTPPKYTSKTDVWWQRVIFLCIYVHLNRQVDRFHSMDVELSVVDNWKQGNSVEIFSLYLLVNWGIITLHMISTFLSRAWSGLLAIEGKIFIYYMLYIS